MHPIEQLIVDEQDIEGTAAYLNLADMSKHEPAYSAYCAALKVRWSNYIFPDLQKHLPLAEQKAYRDICVVKPISGGRSEATYYAAKQSAWFLYTMTGDILTGYRNAHDYMWSGLFRSAPNPAYKKKKVPDMPIQPDEEQTRKWILAHLSEGVAERALACYVDFLKPWHPDAGGSKIMHSLNQQARWTRHNQLPQLPGASDISAIRFFRGHLKDEKFDRAQVGPGGKVTKILQGAVLEVRHIEDTRKMHWFTNYQVDNEELFDTLRLYADFTKEALVKFCSTFPDTMWFIGQIDGVLGKNHDIPHLPIAGPNVIADQEVTPG